MTSAEIRRAFLDFFASKGHDIVPSAPLVIKDDPTLMFTNAGMNQFKDYFLGNKTATNPRVADTQKCLRVSGKHNDLEEVGHDTYHHTLFEMLGNWSFGDYFKKEALAWSWELLTEVYKLPKDKLYATVFGGDEKENLPPDHEAYEIWKQFLPEEQILFGSKKDNFWEMGDTGPCGPCSEVHIDLRTDAEIAAQAGKELVNESHPQVIEIWNNVFMEFNRLANGSLQPLPAQHVDTGMGFERLCMSIQGKTSSYDTDVFTPLLDFISKEAGIAYGANINTDIAMRVLADHVRAVAFTIADGQLPSNNKAGYVIRRILRRAVRYYFNFLGFKEPFLYKLVAILDTQFKTVFPELSAQKDFVARVIQEEEATFLRTLENGLKRLDAIVASTGSNKTIDGRVAFELLDTFGFPLDLTALIARENGMEVDEAGFQTAMLEQKNRSRNAGAMSVGDWVVVQSGKEKVEFTGYDNTEENTHITRYRKVNNKGQIQFQVVLALTPFYANSGGQVGDTGTIQLIGSNLVLEVVDTVKENDLIIHIVEDEDAESLLAQFSGAVHAKINTEKRQATSANHSATHLLHAALRKRLGNHLQQKGSLVNADILRFDFSHFAKVEVAELHDIESEVNAKIRANIALDEKRNVPIDEAKNLGAMALFGEKYGNEVRVITFDPAYSVELCGGTHVKATGEIGFVKILSESSTSAGVRRIEAITGTSAQGYIDSQLNTLNEVKALLKNPADTLLALEALLEDKKRLQKQIEQYQIKDLKELRSNLLASLDLVNGIPALAKIVQVPSAEALKQLCFDLRKEEPNLFVLLAAEIEGKPNLALIIGDETIQTKNVDAVKIIKELGKFIQGGGGGQAFFATAGGKNPAGMQQVIDSALIYIPS